MNKLDYSQVESFVKNNSWNLEVYTRSLGMGESFVKEYVTISWGKSEVTGLPAGSYVKGHHNDTGEHFQIICVESFGVVDKIITLLHEYGHHTSDQSGDTIDKEINAWKDCFKWMNHLNIEITFKVKYLVSKCLGTYLDLYGHSDKVLGFFLEYNIPYKINNDQTHLTLPNPKLLHKFHVKKDYTQITDRLYGKEDWK